MYKLSNPGKLKTNFITGTDDIITGLSSINPAM